MLNLLIGLVVFVQASHRRIWRQTVTNRQTDGRTDVVIAQSPLHTLWGGVGLNKRQVDTINP